MKRALNIMAIALFAMALSAQTPLVQWSREMESKDGKKVIGIVHAENDNTYLLTTLYNQKRAMDEPNDAFDYSWAEPGLEYTIDCFDKNMQLKNSVMLNTSHRRYRETQGFNGHIYAITEFFDKSSYENQLHIAVYDPALKEIVRDKTVANVKAPDQRNKGKFKYTFSTSGQRLLVSSTGIWEKGANLKLQLNVMDANLKLLWSKSIEFPFLAGSYYPMEYNIDEQGDVYLIMEKEVDPKHDDEWIKSSTGVYIPGHTYSLVHISNAGNTQKEYDLKIEGKVISDLNFNIDKNKNVICTGFYSSEKGKYTNGNFYVKVNTTHGSADKPVYTDFSADLMLKFDAFRKVKKNKALNGFQDKFEVRDFSLNDNGSAQLLSEYYYYTAASSSQVVNNGAWSERQSSSTYTYFYLDALLINFDADGKVSWTTRIPKYQKTQDDKGRFSSVGIIKNEDKLHLLFNDNPENDYVQDYSKAKQMDLENSISVLVSIDKTTGKFTRQELWKNGIYDDAINVFCMPAFCKQSSPNSIALVGERHKGYNKKLIEVGSVKLK